MTTISSDHWDLDTDGLQELLDETYKTSRIKICRSDSKDDRVKTEVEVKMIDRGWMTSGDDKNEFIDLAVSSQEYDISAEITTKNSYKALLQEAWKKV